MIRTDVDAGVLIAAGRGKGPGAVPDLVLLDDPDRVFVSSVFVRLEVLPKAIYHRRQEEAAIDRAFFDRVSARAGPLDRVVAEAEQEAGRSGLNGLDALHVAAAVVLRADELVTTERSGKPIHPVTGVRVVSIYPAAVG